MIRTVNEYLVHANCMIGSDKRAAVNKIIQKAAGIDSASISTAETEFLCDAAIWAFAHQTEQQKRELEVLQKNRDPDREAIAREIAHEIVSDVAESWYTEDRRRLGGAIPAVQPLEYIGRVAVVKGGLDQLEKAIAGYFLDYGNI